MLRLHRVSRVIVIATSNRPQQLREKWALPKNKKNKSLTSY